MTEEVVVSTSCILREVSRVSGQEGPDLKQEHFLLRPRSQTGAFFAQGFEKLLHKCPKHRCPNVPCLDSLTCE